jgi:hypothetical protein
MMTQEEIDDVGRRAEALYEQKLKATLERDHLHKFVGIEPESGDFILGKTLSEAGWAIRDAHPGRPTYVLRIGHSAAVEIGGASFPCD